MKRLSQRDVPSFSSEIHFIDGEPVAGEGAALEACYPATGETIVTVASAADNQLERALEGARASFDDRRWRSRSRDERASILNDAADKLMARHAELTTRVVLDNGKTASEAAIDGFAAAAALRSAAQCVLEDEPRTLDPERGVEKRVWRQPVGVVAGLIPFNAPLMFTALKAAPALASGNSVIVKPSERAPLVPIAFAEAVAQAGVPEGVLSIVHGGVETAQRLCDDDRIDLISLTGGTPAGAAVLRSSALTIKNALLELGGKSAHIVLADGDLDAALASVLGSIFRNAGQRCFSGSRLVLEASIADAFEERLVDKARALRIGDPFEEDTQIGAMIDARALESVDVFVERARTDGWSVATGGERVSELEPGTFYRPTVLLGASAEAFASQEEIFGPVLTVIRVSDADEAVRVANDSRYGLAGGVWTRDTERALEMARHIRCGVFWINTYGAIFGDVPFGGYKQSGIGREAGTFGYESYTELKTVLLDTTSGTSGPRL